MDLIDEGRNLYVYKKEGKGRELTIEEQVTYIQELLVKHPIDTIEDGMTEQDWDGWQVLTKGIADNV